MVVMNAFSSGAQSIFSGTGFSCIGEELMEALGIDFLTFLHSSHFHILGNKVGFFTAQANFRSSELAERYPYVAGLVRIS